MANDNASYIQTVNGPISPDALGVTLSHEHIFIDYTCAWSPPGKEYAHLVQGEILPEQIEEIRRNPQHVRANLILDDQATAIEELDCFRRVGGDSVIELSNCGLSPDPMKLRHVSNQTNIHIVAGCGYYRYIAQEPSVLQIKSEEIADEIIKCLKVGIGRTDVCAGIIGEIGTSSPVHPFERESLIGAAQAHLQTGAAINVHPESRGYEHLQVLDILENAGVDPSCIVMSHMDELTETDWHLKVAERGVWISFDTFGSELCFDGIEEPRDTDRVDCLIRLMDKGYVDRLLLSQDICYKVNLHKFGGNGYDHILSNIVPVLKERGISEDELSKMLIENPARLLTISA